MQVVYIIPFFRRRSADEQKRRGWPSGVCKARPAAQDGGGDGVDGGLLADDALGERLTQGQKPFAVGLAEPADGDTGAFGDDGSDILPGQTHGALGAADGKLAAHERAQLIAELRRLLILCACYGLFELLLELLLALDVLAGLCPAEPDVCRALV